MVINAKIIKKKKIMSRREVDFKKRCNCKKKTNQRISPSIIKLSIEFVPERNKQNTK